MTKCTCGSTETRIEPGTPPHHGKQVCNNCGAFIGWEPKPSSPHRPAGERNLVAKYGQGFCEFCGRKTEALPSGAYLVGHHVVPYAEGGSARERPPWILCDSCHGLVEAARSCFKSNATPRSKELRNESAD